MYPHSNQWIAVYVTLCSFISLRSTYPDILGTPSGVFHPDITLVQSIRSIGSRKKLREINSGATAVTSKCKTDQAKYVTFDETLHWHIKRCSRCPFSQLQSLFSLREKRMVPASCCASVSSSCARHLPISPKKWSRIFPHCSLMGSDINLLKNYPTAFDHVSLSTLQRYDQYSSAHYSWWFLVVYHCLQIENKWGAKPARWPVYSFHHYRKVDLARK